MLKALKNKFGFASFVEVTVTAVIFIIAAFGIFTTVSSLRPQSSDSAQRLQYVYVAKAAYDQIRGYVDADIWGNYSGPLWPGIVHTLNVGTDFYVNYLLTDQSDGTRAIDLNVYER